jgi:hypothetical protein
MTPLVRVLLEGVLILMGAVIFFAPYPSRMLDRAPRADDPADRGATRFRNRRFAGAAYMSTGLALIALNLFFPD